MLNKYKKTVEKFLQYLQVEKQYSPDTIRAYKVDLKQFFNSLDSNLPLTRISTNNIQQFLQELSRNKMSERTLSRKLASIKSLFNYLVMQEQIPVNIAKLIKSPKIPKRLPNYLSIKEISSLLNYPYGDTFKDYRDRLILELFYATGLRISELIKIKIGKRGCNPLKPALNLSKFNKSIPKTNLCKKNPNILLSLW